MAVQGQHRPQRGLSPSRCSSPDRPCAPAWHLGRQRWSASSRSTPAHSDWISPSRGSPADCPGGGLATMATSMSSRSAGCGQVLRQRQQPSRPAAPPAARAARPPSPRRRSRSPAGLIARVSSTVSAWSRVWRRTAASVAVEAAHLGRLRPGSVSRTRPCHRLAALPPPGPGDAGDRQRALHRRVARRALGHRARHRFADRAVRLDQRGRHAQQLGLGGVAVVTSRARTSRSSRPDRCGPRRSGRRCSSRRWPGASRGSAAASASGSGCRPG